MRKFVCTDPDCSQYVMEISFTSYLFIEYVELSDEFAVRFSRIDLTDYSVEEILDYCKSYYCSLESIVSAYRFKDSFRIIAECIFEQLDFSETDNAEFATEKDAIEFIHKWMEGEGSL